MFRCSMSAGFFGTFFGENELQPNVADDSWTRMVRSERLHRPDDIVLSRSRKHRQNVNMGSKSLVNKSVSVPDIKKEKIDNEANKARSRRLNLPTDSCRMERDTGTRYANGSTAPLSR
ncbi:unnamed protein product, partial [Nesidiocoris tenuis]